MTMRTAMTMITDNDHSRKVPNLTMALNRKGPRIGSTELYYKAVRMLGLVNVSRSHIEDGCRQGLT